jgi:NADH-quinone oxidoreductase subunit A
LFDIETAFIFTFAVVFKKLGLFAIIETFIFIFILIIGWLYLYRKKAYKWE